MTPSFWNGKPHEFGFQKPLPGKGVRERHHARFWTTRYINPSGDRYFVGTASLDIGLKWMIAHRIKADIDSEREFLFQDLQRSGRIIKSNKIFFVEPTLGKNFIGDMFFTDGKIYILELAD